MPLAIALQNHSGNSLPSNVRANQSAKGRMEETHDSWPVQLSPAGDAWPMRSNCSRRLGDEARPLAGGHSLVPMMKLRLASPEHLVDLHGVAGLKGIRRDGNTIVIGAMTTQHELLASDEIGKSLPILHETALLIADPQVRYRGTIGGNVANGDPGNDMPALMLTLGASYRLEGASGAREVAAREFYQGAYFTALEPGEILTSISIPVPPAGHGYAYEKLKRKVGDYATAAAAVVLTMAGGKVATCAIGLTNLSETPLLAEDAAQGGDRHQPRCRPR